MTPVSVTVGLLSWVVSFLFTAAAALLLGRALRTRRASLDAAAALFLWIWVTTFITFVLGLTGRLSAGSLGVVGAAGLIVLFGIRRTRQALLEEVGGWTGTRDRIVRGWRGLPRWLRWLSLGFLVFGGLRFSFLIWALPPFVWDSLTYHLTNVAQWIQDGRIGLFDAPVQRIYSPANYEVLAAWFSLFLHHDVVIEAAGLPAYGLAGLSVYAIARALRLSAVGSWVATVAYFSTPALVYAATGTKNDPFVAAVFLFLAALILHLREGIDGEGSLPIKSTLVLGVLGLTYALGTKAYILQLSVGLGLLAVVPGYQRDPVAQWRVAVAQLKADLLTTSRAGRIFLVALAGCGIFLGGYWNTRNWILKGNPFYPYAVAIESEASPGTGSGHYGLGLARLEENLGVLASKFGDKQSRIVPDLPETTGWGWLAYGMGLIATAWALAVDRRFRFLALGFLASMVFLMASNTTSPWNMRYFIWLPALFALGIGIFVDPIERMDPSRRRVLATLFGFGLVMNVIMTVNYNLVSTQEIVRILSFSVWERDAGRLRVRAPVEYELAYAYVPREALLGYSVHENGFIYPLYRADFSQRLVFIPVTADDTCEEIARAMEARGTRYLFVAPEHSDDSLILRLRQCAATTSPIRERAGGLYVVKRDDG